VTVHSEHPFLPTPEARDRVRQLRGRLVAPVTILTAGEDGMTASAVLVMEGDPPRLVATINELADFRDAVARTQKFVMQVAGQDHRHLSDRFAEIGPSPGGLFHDLTVVETEWGPRIDGFDTWAGCSLETTLTVGYQILVVGMIDYLEVGDLQDPLIYFRGRYRKLS
jgi:3-hydroxy-9,10-secoandrosta-1,3,5(10)-triene-9,17-dione monooxygenase reductase component